MPPPWGEGFQLSPSKSLVWLKGMSKPRAMISIATWNINSVRLRMEQVERFLTQEAPDVLCLQEIKCTGDQFPREVFERLGYGHIAVHGQKGYHGVATVSRIPIAETARHDWQDNGDGRHVGVDLIDQNIFLENVYIPAGGDIPDREANPKFGQKLDFLERMTVWSKGLDRPTLLVGDFNVAPLESDVYNHKALLKVVSHTPLEVETLARLAAAHDWVDLGRKHIPAPERNYSWWSYRSYWRDKDQGRRLDHMWASPQLAARSTEHKLVEETRKWDQPSDHIPLITRFDA